MDLRSMKRNELQALCKTHGLPANSTKAQMIVALSAVLQPPTQRREGVKRKTCLRSSDGGEEGGKLSRALKKVRFSPPDDCIDFTNLPSAPNDELFSPGKRRSSRRFSVIGTASPGKLRSSRRYSVIGTELQPQEAHGSEVEASVRGNRAKATMVLSPVMEKQKSNKRTEDVPTKVEDTKSLNSYAEPTVPASSGRSSRRHSVIGTELQPQEAHGDDVLRTQAKATTGLPPVIEKKKKWSKRTEDVPTKVEDTKSLNSYALSGNLRSSRRYSVIGTELQPQEVHGSGVEASVPRTKEKATMVLSPVMEKKKWNKRTEVVPTKIEDTKSLNSYAVPTPASAGKLRSSRRHSVIGTELQRQEAHGNDVEASDTRTQAKATMVISPVLEKKKWNKRTEDVPTKFEVTKSLDSYAEPTVPPSAGKLRSSRRYSVIGTELQRQEAHGNDGEASFRRTQAKATTVLSPVIEKKKWNKRTKDVPTNVEDTKSLISYAEPTVRALRSRVVVTEKSEKADEKVMLGKGDTKMTMENEKVGGNTVIRTQRSDTTTKKIEPAEAVPKRMETCHQGPVVRSLRHREVIVEAKLSQLADKKPNEAREVTAEGNEKFRKIDNTRTDNKNTEKKDTVMGVTGAKKIEETVRSSRHQQVIVEEKPRSPADKKSGLWTIQRNNKMDGNADTQRMQKKSSLKKGSALDEGSSKTTVETSQKEHRVRSLRHREVVVEGKLKSLVDTKPRRSPRKTEGEQIQEDIQGSTKETSVMASEGELIQHPFISNVAVRDDNERAAGNLNTRRSPRSNNVDQKGLLLAEGISKRRTSNNYNDVHAIRALRHREIVAEKNGQQPLNNAAENSRKRPRPRGLKLHEKAVLSDNASPRKSQPSSRNVPMARSFKHSKVSLKGVETSVEHIKLKRTQAKHELDKKEDTTSKTGKVRAFAKKYVRKKQHHKDTSEEASAHGGKITVNASACEGSAVDPLPIQSTNRVSNSSNSDKHTVGNTFAKKTQKRARSGPVPGGRQKRTKVAGEFAGKFKFNTKETLALDNSISNQKKVEQFQKSSDIFSLEGINPSSLEKNEFNTEITDADDSEKLKLGERFEVSGIQFPSQIEQKNTCSLSDSTDQSAGMLGNTKNGVGGELPCFPTVTMGKPYATEATIDIKDGDNRELTFLQTATLSESIEDTVIVGEGREQPYLQTVTTNEASEADDVVKDGVSIDLHCFQTVTINEATEATGNIIDGESSELPCTLASSINDDEHLGGDNRGLTLLQTGDNRGQTLLQTVTTNEATEATDVVKDDVSIYLHRFQTVTINEATEATVDIKDGESRELPCSLTSTTTDLDATKATAEVNDGENRAPPCLQTITMDEATEAAVVIKVGDSRELPCLQTSTTTDLVAAGATADVKGNASKELPFLQTLTMNEATEATSLIEDSDSGEFPSLQTFTMSNQDAPKATSHIEDSDSEEFPCMQTFTMTNQDATEATSVVKVSEVRAIPCVQTHTIHEDNKATADIKGSDNRELPLSQTFTMINLDATEATAESRVLPYSQTVTTSEDTEAIAIIKDGDRRELPCSQIFTLVDPDAAETTADVKESENRELPCSQTLTTNEATEATAHSKGSDNREFPCTMTDQDATEATSNVKVSESRAMPCLQTHTIIGANETIVDIKGTDNRELPYPQTFTMTDMDATEATADVRESESRSLPCLQTVTMNEDTEAIANIEDDARRALPCSQIIIMTDLDAAEVTADAKNGESSELPFLQTFTMTGLDAAEANADVKDIESRELPGLRTLTVNEAIETAAHIEDCVSREFPCSETFTITDQDATEATSHGEVSKSRELPCLQTHTINDVREATTTFKGSAGRELPYPLTFTVTDLDATETTADVRKSESRALPSLQTVTMNEDTKAIANIEVDDRRELPCSQIFTMTDLDASEATADVKDGEIAAIPCLRTVIIDEATEIPSAVKYDDNCGSPCSQTDMDATEGAADISYTSQSACRRGPLVVKPMSDSCIEYQELHSFLTTPVEEAGSFSTVYLANTSENVHSEGGSLIAEADKVLSDAKSYLFCSDENPSNSGSSGVHLDLKRDTDTMEFSSPLNYLSSVQHPKLSEACRKNVEHLSSVSENINPETEMLGTGDDPIATYARKTVIGDHDNSCHSDEYDRMLECKDNSEANPYCKDGDTQAGPYATTEISCFDTIVDKEIISTPYDVHKSPYTKESVESLVHNGNPEVFDGKEYIANCFDNSKDAHGDVMPSSIDNFEGRHDISEMHPMDSECFTPSPGRFSRERVNTSASSAGCSDVSKSTNIIVAVSKGEVQEETEWACNSNIAMPTMISETICNILDVMSTKSTVMLKNSEFAICGDTFQGHIIDRQPSATEDRELPSTVGNVSEKIYYEEIRKGKSHDKTDVLNKELECRSSPSVDFSPVTRQQAESQDASQYHKDLTEGIDQAFCLSAPKEVEAGEASNVKSAVWGNLESNIEEKVKEASYAYNSNVQPGLAHDDCYGEFDADDITENDFSVVSSDAYERSNVNDTFDRDMYYSKKLSDHSITFKKSSAEKDICNSPPENIDSCIPFELPNSKAMPSKTVDYSFDCEVQLLGNASEGTSISEPNVELSVRDMPSLILYSSESALERKLLDTVHHEPTSMPVNEKPHSPFNSPNSCEDDRNLTGESESNAHISGEEASMECLPAGLAFEEHDLQLLGDKHEGIQCSLTNKDEACEDDRNLTGESESIAHISGEEVSMECLPAGLAFEEHDLQLLGDKHEGIQCSLINKDEGAGFDILLSEEANLVHNSQKISVTTLSMAEKPERPLDSCSLSEVQINIGISPESEVQRTCKTYPEEKSHDNELECRSSPSVDVSPVIRQQVESQDVSQYHKDLTEGTAHVLCVSTPNDVEAGAITDEKGAVWGILEENNSEEKEVVQAGLAHDVCYGEVDADDISDNDFSNISSDAYKRSNVNDTYDKDTCYSKKLSDHSITLKKSSPEKDICGSPPENRDSCIPSELPNSKAIPSGMDFDCENQSLENASEGTSRSEPIVNVSVHDVPSLMLSSSDSAFERNLLDAVHDEPTSISMNQEPCSPFKSPNSYEDDRNLIRESESIAHISGEEVSVECLSDGLAFEEHDLQLLGVKHEGIQCSLANKVEGVDFDLLFNEEANLAQYSQKISGTTFSMAEKSERSLETSCTFSEVHVNVGISPESEVQSTCKMDNFGFTYPEEKPHGNASEETSGSEPNVQLSVHDMPSLILSSSESAFERKLSDVFHHEPTSMSVNEKPCSPCKSSNSCEYDRNLAGESESIAHISGEKVSVECLSAGLAFDEHDLQLLGDKHEGIQCSLSNKDKGPGFDISFNEDANLVQNTQKISASTLSTVEKPESPLETSCDLSEVQINIGISPESEVKLACKMVNSGFTYPEAKSHGMKDDMVGKILDVSVSPTNALNAEDIASPCHATCTDVNTAGMEEGEECLGYSSQDLDVDSVRPEGSLLVSGDKGHVECEECVASEEYVPDPTFRNKTNTSAAVLPLEDNVSENNHVKHSTFDTSPSSHNFEEQLQDQIVVNESSAVHGAVCDEKSTIPSFLLEKEDADVNYETRGDSPS